MDFSSVRVREGNTGILRLQYDDGREEQYVPDYDLARARELLLEWQELKGDDGRRLKDSYWVDGINWFPTVVNFAHGRVFANYVRYRPLVECVLENELRPAVEGGGEFSRLLSIVMPSRRRRPLTHAAYNAVIALNNRLVAHRRQAPILFFRYTADDFRTLAAKEALDSLGVKYVEAVIGQKHVLLGSLRSLGTRFIYGRTASRNMFKRRYYTEGLGKHVRVLFERTTDLLETMMSTFVAEYRSHLRTLRWSSFRTLYGIDDTQIVFPLLYACQERGVRTVAHQHGAAYQQWHASYVMEGLEPAQIRWFDALIVWDKYWKERFLALSNLRPSEDLVVGCDLFGDQFGGSDTAPPPGARTSRVILVPYEFLANTHQVGRYVTKLLHLGYDIWFKPRADEDVGRQLDAYCLPADSRDKVKIVHRLTRQLIAGIDVVAGTTSTLVYQLIPFGKAVWLLETDYPGYLEHLADQGYLHRIRYEDLEALEARHFSPCKRDFSRLISSATLKDTLARYVVNASDRSLPAEQVAARTAPRDAELAQGRSSAR